MKLSVIILHHNTPTEVETLLQSLNVAILPTETEVLVIDNGNTHTNSSIKQEYKNLNIRWFETPNDGFPAGQNFGVANSTGEYIAVLNPDIELDKDCLQHLLQHLETTPECGLATARLEHPTGEIQHHTRVFPSVWNTIKNRLLPGNKKPIVHHYDTSKSYIPIDWCTGALWVIRRSALQHIAGHDERYFLFMSDIALCCELWHAKWHVHIVPTAKAIHGESRLSAGNPLTMLMKKTGRHHIKDAFIYHKQYLGQSLPALCPSGKSVLH